MRTRKNYFAEVQQVVFHLGHLVPDIDVVNDPLLQGRLISYLDTQISRPGGPNFGQLPINRPHVPVNGMLRDGMHASADHAGVALYKPNSLDGGCPFHAGVDAAAFIDIPQAVQQGLKARANPATPSDHFSQTTPSYHSLTAMDQDHVAQAYAFELGTCYEQTIRQRQRAALANIDADLGPQVAEERVLPAPDATKPATE